MWAKETATAHRHLASMIIFTRIRPRDYDTNFPKACLLRKKTNRSYNPNAASRYDVFPKLADHDYFPYAEAGLSISTLDEDSIHQLIAERLQCRINRDFDRADAIQQKLNDAHVHLDDLRKLWRCDGKRFPHDGKEYTYATNAGPIISGMPEEKITQLIRERFCCRISRDFETADQIQATLLDAGVFVNDNDRTWRADGESFSGERQRVDNALGGRNVERIPVGGAKRNPPRNAFGFLEHNYQRAEAAGESISPLSEAEIHRLIEERLRYKMNHDYDRADAIHKELIAANVQLDDKNRLWRSDGKRFATGVYDYDYAPDAGRITSTMPFQKIRMLLRERLTCRFNQEWNKADSIRAELNQAGVFVSDREKLWRADGKPFPKHRQT